MALPLLLLLVGVLLVRGGAASSADALPTLPESYSMLIEHNDVARRSTTHVRVYRDAVTAQSRFDVTRVDGARFTEIVTPLTRYEVFRTDHGAPLTCTSSPANTDPRRAALAHYTTFFSMFDDARATPGAEQPAVRRGEPAVVRGVPADTWTRGDASAFTSFAMGAPDSSSTEFSFMRQGWTDDHTATYQVPLRVHVVGTQNGTREEHYYEIIDFDGVPLSDWQRRHVFADCAAFGVDDDGQRLTRCRIATNSTGAPSYGYDLPIGGGLAGVFLGTIGVAAVWMLLRRRNEARIGAAGGGS